LTCEAYFFAHRQSDPQKRGKSDHCTAISRKRTKESSMPRPPLSKIAILLLLWNIAGVAAWAFQSSASPEQLAAGDPATAQIWRMMPTWAWGAYALAVWTGLGGAIALLLRRKVAIALFATSLIGVVVQFGWSFLGSPLLALKGWASVLFPALIITITLAALLHSRRLAAKGALA
jgi:hypothetical protein